MNVCEALPPFLMIPVSKLPLRAVAVWGLGPLFIQVTVSPTCTVIVLGVNWKSAIPTLGSLAAWAQVAGRVVGCCRAEATPLASLALASAR